ncbi:TPA: MBL fold metallo-hydrolase, partial [Haemophilus influenzae]
IKAKSSILYTGDGSFNNHQLLSYFQSAMGSERMQQIYCLQVMHHGSRDNWFKGVAAVLSPSLSVFSADETRKDCKHPHDEVVRDFLPYNPILVNKQKMLHLEFI